MIPYSVIGKTNYRAYGTFFLLVLMCGFFLWEIFVSAGQGVPMTELFDDYALVTCQVGQVAFSETLIDGFRSLFLYENFFLFLTNALFLWVFAPRVEKFFGAKRFVFVYLLIGFISLIFSIFAHRTDCLTVIGSNGPIAGMLAMFLVLYPTKRVMAGVPLIGRNFDLPAMFFVLMYLAVQIFAPQGGPLSGEIAPYWDEVGGFITGFVMIFIATMFKPAPSAGMFDDDLS